MDWQVLEKVDLTKRKNSIEGQHGHEIFDFVDYTQFTPRVERAEGTYIITRSGTVIPSLKWSWRTTYHSPIAFVCTGLVSLASLAKRRAAALQGEHRELAIIHSTWSAGYYHWLTESLPRAYLLKQHFPEAIPLLPTRRYLQYADSLKSVGHNDVVLFPQDQNIWIKDPIITECPPVFGTTHPELLAKVRLCVLDSIKTKERSDKRIVYVSRAKARGRSVINETEVVTALQRFNVASVCFEDLTFFEQVTLMKSASVLISIHGAGLSNMMFMPKGSAVIELIPRKNGVFDYSMVRNTLKHDGCYVRLASAMGHRYSFLQCETDAKFCTGTHMANLKVNIDQLTELVAQENK